MRTLSWKHTLGLVTMDVELADRTLSVAVTPVQAVVLLYFQDQGEPAAPPGPGLHCLSGRGRQALRPPRGTAGADEREGRGAARTSVPAPGPQPPGPWRR